MTLYHEVEGSGPPVLFIHEGIVDSRVWDPQWGSFDAYRRVRFDFAGSGARRSGPCREIPGARSARIARTAHVPSLERPADFDGLVLDFLSNVFAA